MSSLRTKAVAGVLWGTGLSVFRDFMQFGIMLILVRLLAPEMYGQFGLVTSVMGFLSVFSYRMFLEYTLQIRPGNEVDYQIYFTAGVFVQIFLFLVTNVAAEVLKHFHQYAAVAPLVHIMSIVFLSDLVHEFRYKMLERELDWKRLRILEGIGVVANAVLALILAAAGAGVYALLIPSLITAIPAFVDLVFIQRWRPTWKWDFAAFEPARKYGITRLTSAIFVWSRQLMESTILIQQSGFAIYGVYGRALGLATISCLKVPTLLAQALFPVLTKLNIGNKSYNEASTLFFCSVTWLTFPVAILLSTLAFPVVHTLYGPSWSAVTPFLPWAMLAGTATALAQTANILLLATLQQRRSMWIDGLTLAGAALGLLVLAPRGLTLYLMWTASMQGLAFLFMLAWLYRTRTILLHGILVALVLPTFIAGTSFWVMELVRTTLGFSKESLRGAVFYGVAFCVVYALLLRLTSGQQFREIVNLLPGRTYLQRWLVLGPACSAIPKA